MSAVLAGMTPGFRDVVHDAQQTFRALLDAMARPGRVRPLPDRVRIGLATPPEHACDRTMGIGAAAILLALLDAETSVDLVGALRTEAACAYLRFHTGVRVADTGEPAPYTLARAADVDAALWSRLDLGTDEVPQTGATLIVEVPGLVEGAVAKGHVCLRLRGPGIEHEAALAVAGLPRAFWHWRVALASRFPRGVDLVLVSGTSIAALPRSTRIALAPSS